MNYTTPRLFAQLIEYATIAGMRKEALGNLPTVPLENLAHQTEEQWEKNWQDLNFAKIFPKHAAVFVSPKGKMELSEHDRKLMAERSLTTFMTLSWKPGPKAVAGTAVFVDKNLNPVPPTYRGIESRPSTESLLRVNIGCHILMGKSLKDKDYIDNLMSQRSSEFTHAKIPTLRSHFSRLITNDNLFANWVKTHSLDNQNGFEWNRETARLFLQLCSKSDRSLPLEFEQDLTIYPLEVIDEFVGHALKYVNGPYTIDKRPSSRHASPSVFIARINELYESGYFYGSPLAFQLQGKIKNLKALIANKPA